MPDRRCKWHLPDGSPYRGGCTTPGCRFVHPGQKGWNSPRLQKLSARCMFFDSHGKSINGGCRSKSCRFVHPTDRDWEVAEKPRAHIERKSSSPAVSSVSRSTQADTDQRTAVSNESRIVRPPPPPLGGIKTARDPVESRTPALSGSSAIAQPKSDIPSIAAAVGPEPKQASRAMPQPSSTSSRYPQMDLRRPSATSESASSLPKSTDGDLRQQISKKRIFLLAQGHNLIQKISEIEADLERRTALQSIIPVGELSAGAALETLKDSSRKKKSVLEEKLDSIISQLIEEDIWPLPSTTQSDVSVERRLSEFSTSITELRRRFDVTETQSDKIRGMVTPSRGLSVVHGGEVVRPSKRRRISANGSFKEPFNLQDILARLDSLQNKAVELEAEALYDDRLFQVVDERIEGWLVEKPVARPVQDDILEGDVQVLVEELDVMCGEQAYLATDDLASHIGTLRLETGNLKETMDLPASDPQSLQQRLADLNLRTREVMEEFDELQRKPQDKPEIPNGYEQIIGEVRTLIEIEVAQLHNTSKSLHEELEKNAFARLEPTILATQTIYNSLRSQTNAV